MERRQVFLDNAATTPIAPEVLETMIPIMTDFYGNPSSSHSFGRSVRAQIEYSRRSIAKHLNVTPAEIVFTSGGTEADNMAIRCSLKELNIKHAITTDIEHHAVLDTLESICAEYDVRLSKVRIDEKGYVDVSHLDELLANNERSFVSIMHANNEIGNLIDLDEVSELCLKHNAVFHSDTVQTMAHYPFDFSKTKIDFATCSAHKFHGPKGIGFLYINKNLKITSMLIGGGQERGLRAGTENVYGIVGLAKAMDLSYLDVEEHAAHIKGLKYAMLERFQNELPGVSFNGDPKGNSLYTILNVALPPTDKAGMLLFNLDINGIAVSGGSACSSGAGTSSHVLAGIAANPDCPAVRFSFSRYTTKEEIDYAVDCVLEFYNN
jgi:cysteine desulfurase